MNRTAPANAMIVERQGTRVERRAKWKVVSLKYEPGPANVPQDLRDSRAWALVREHPSGIESCTDLVQFSISTETGSYFRLIDSCITQLKAQGPSRTCNESKEEEEEASLGADWLAYSLTDSLTDEFTHALTHLLIQILTE